MATNEIEASQVTSTLVHQTQSNSQLEGAARALLQAALAYAARGWRVFPCWWIREDGTCACGGKASNCKPGKHPLGLAAPHGFEDATTDGDQIRAWWMRWPMANVAVATGAASGLVVVDLDVKPGKDGRAALRAIAEKVRQPVPRTLVAHTGGGGLHLYFKHPGGHIESTCDKIAAGVDVRADGGYVLAPPSNHESGGFYAW